MIDHIEWNEITLLKKCGLEQSDILAFDEKFQITMLGKKLSTKMLLFS